MSVGGPPAGRCGRACACRSPGLDEVYETALPRALGE